MTALWDDAGQLRGYAKVVRDSTERRRALEQRAALVREQADRAEAEATAWTVRALEHAAMAEAEIASARASVLAEVSGVLVEDFMDHRPMLSRVAQIAADATHTACVIQLVAQDRTSAELRPPVSAHPDQLIRGELARVLSAPHRLTDSPRHQLEPAFLDRYPLMDTLSVPMLARTVIIGVLSLGRFGVDAA